MLVAAKSSPLIGRDQLYSIGYAVYDTVYPFWNSELDRIPSAENGNILSFNDLESSELWNSVGLRQVKTASISTEYSHRQIIRIVPTKEHCKLLG